jgi:hypothetical protein
MKTKKFEKKLTLNKKTVANLNILAMKNVQGGVMTQTECLTCPIEYSPLPCNTRPITTCVITNGDLICGDC